MSGLVRTMPYPAVIERIREAGGAVVFPETAELDQVNGALYALEHGYEKIAVTIAGPDMAEDVRAAAPAALIIAVHTTGLTMEEAERLVAVADITTACASGTVREAARTKALVQGGTGVPIFALTPKVETQRRMALLRNVTSLFLEQSSDRDEVLRAAEDLLLAQSHVQRGDMIVLTIGEPMGKSGGTNTMKIVRVGDHRS
jgi:hypothetical protein